MMIKCQKHSESNQAVKRRQVRTTARHATGLKPDQEQEYITSKEVFQPILRVEIKTGAILIDRRKDTYWTLRGGHDRND
ncbi:hypothetical protein [Brevibacillus massiliensis]|nr:hypothetical protein [Brevibacillus massiliensis]